MSGIKNKAVSEMILKRKLTQKNSRKDGEDDVDDVSLYPMIQKKENPKHTNKNYEEENVKEDSKTFIISKKPKLDSLCPNVNSDDTSSSTTAATKGGDFLSIYLAERDKKKKKSKNKKT